MTNLSKKSDHLNMKTLFFIVDDQNCHDAVANFTVVRYLEITLLLFMTSLLLQYFGIN